MEFRVWNGKGTTNDERRTYGRMFRDALGRMVEMGGLARAIAVNLLEKAQYERQIIDVTISHPPPKATIGYGVDNPGIMIFPDDDFYPGEPGDFPNPNGPDGPIPDLHRQIIIIGHEWSHAFLGVRDPESVVIENMIRKQLGYTDERRYYIDEHRKSYPAPKHLNEDDQKQLDGEIKRTSELPIPKVAK